jgi:hypothetical protein
MKQPSLRPLSAILDACIEPVLRAQGFAGKTILSHWPEIVGERLAARTRPVKIAWPTHRPAPGEAAEPATLTIRTEGAFALDVQQATPLILSRVNAHLGWACIGRIIIRQGPVEVAEAPKPRRLPPPSQAVVATAAQVTDDGLRAALERLGAAVAAREG